MLYLTDGFLCSVPTGLLERSHLLAPAVEEASKEVGAVLPARGGWRREIAEKWEEGWREMGEAD